jgi:hypothetical protein
MESALIRMLNRKQIRRQKVIPRIAENTRYLRSITFGVRADVGVGSLVPDMRTK